MPRFFIRTLMAFIIVTAVALTALRNANEQWAGMMLLAALATLGTAILAAINLGGREQAWWRGFALFSGGYLVAAFGPVQSHLATTQLLIHMHPVVTSPGTGPPVYPIFWRQRADVLARIERLKAAGQGPNDRELSGAMNVLANLNTQLAGTPNQEEFLRVGHCLLALLSGLLGGAIAMRFYAKRVREVDTDRRLPQYR
jgi:hypothetical protein